MASSFRLFLILTKTRFQNEGKSNLTPSRRHFYQYDPRELSSILGVPSRPSHLPEAEHILPGHTLLRPTLGMLKSAVKFPHRELDDGAGVYGSVNNLGIRYDSRNERLMYSGFRRFPSDYIMVIPSPSPTKDEKPRFKLESAVLNLDRETQAKNDILKILKKLSIPALKGVKLFLVTEDGNNFEKMSKPTNDYSYYLNEETPKHIFNEPNKQILRYQQENNAFPDESMQATVSAEKSAIRDDDNAGSVEDAKKKKTQWLFNSKNSFDHIKIMQDAPEISDFIPNINNEEIRKWWFYNGDDYQPFLKERHK